MSPARSIALLLLFGCATTRELPDWVARGTGLVSDGAGRHFQAVVETADGADGGATAECLLGELLGLYAARFAELAVSTGVVPAAEREAFRATHLERLRRPRPTVAVHRVGATGYALARLDFQAAIDALPTGSRMEMQLAHTLAVTLEAEECRSAVRTKCGDIHAFCPTDAAP